MRRLNYSRRIAVLGVAVAVSTAGAVSVVGAFPAAAEVSPLRAVAAPAATSVAPAAQSGTPAKAKSAAKATKLAEKLVKKVTAASANRHLIALQRIAAQHDGNRSADSAGYDASVDYVVSTLRRAGFAVRTPTFTYDTDVADANSISVAGTAYQLDKMAESIDTPAGGLTGALVVVPEDATTGCEATDFAGLELTGAVALIRRGGCTFEQKALNAAGLGAVAVAISNNVPGPLTNVTITNQGPVPVGGISQQDGDTLAGLAGEQATVDLRYHVEQVQQRNVIAQTRTGKKDNVVMLGAHLDSVPVGPGINDNGTGSAGLLELALQLGSSPKVNNAVRFAWWGAEELGLLGSSAYAAGLTFEQQLDISMYLNFDMIGSPNAGYFVYDGDDSDAEGAGAGPYGSAQIEQTFTDFFSSRLGVPTQGTDFDGRSDYGGFIELGIPSGGLFTGAEGVKTADQVALWGGTAGIAYDPCYHAACDNLGNVDRAAFDRNLDATAWATGVYAWSTESVNGVPPRAARAALRAAAMAKAGPAKAGTAAASAAAA
ncbi:M28 family metallopeptidase [Nakamurella lactea]|uniref:M28 family metallopeptidase n=1 Tax=Nakamurella lactea TaxID=459515 RepID=UPI0004251859|nr:M28 family metallopeptidase [Nakamurella lactea]